MNFTRKDKVGVITLSVILLIGIVLLNVEGHFYVPDPTKIDEAKLTYFEVDQNEPNGADANPSENNQFSEKKYTLRNFDPNQYNISDWMKIGFSEKQAASIVQFKENYGPFEKKKDIQKLYVVSDEKYAEIAPYLVFPEKENQYKYSGTADRDTLYVPQEPKTPILLNTASKEELVTISGIGETFASRIIKYRETVGGFVSKEQLDELYISEDAKLALKENVEIRTDDVRKTNVNTASKNELKKVPFMTWEICALIMKERDRNPPLENLNFIPQDVFAQTNQEKLLFYLNF